MVCPQKQVITDIAKPQALGICGSIFVALVNLSLQL
jgi:hypothetical protein